MSQVSLRPVHAVVNHGDRVLSHPFAGGMNSPQFQTSDLDGDGDLDLVVLDRSTSSISCFENIEESYSFNPEMSLSFPIDLQHWFILADYDCDGIKELFTFTNLGVRVFRHTIQNQTSVWTLVEEPLTYNDDDSEINIFLNSSDLPAISDVDNDGDLDLLSFNFSNSSRIEFYKNYAIENGGSCGLDFKKETSAYGNILDCGCDHFVAADDCDTGGRILHIGGKTIVSADLSGDGLQDLILSQEDCGNLTFAMNEGTLEQSTFSEFTLSIPDQNGTLDANFFPASFLEDINFDDKKDLLVASNDRSNPSETIDFAQSAMVYLNTGAIGNPTFSTGTSFLQDQMIEVGEAAYPAIADINLDGLPDLVIGNRSSLIDGKQVSSLTYYESNGSELSFVSEDLFELSKLGLKHINPQFVDLNHDGFIDLFFSTEDRLARKIFYFLLSEQGTFDYSNARSVDFPTFYFQDYVLDDLDGDGIYEILIGLFSGRLDVYQTSFPVWPAAFTIKEEGLLSISGDTDKGYLSLTTGDLDQDGNMDLITGDESGVVQFYSNFRSGNAAAQSNIITFDQGETVQNSRFSSTAYLAIGEFLGQPSMLVGDLRGGITWWAGEPQTEDLALDLEAFPSPTLEDKRLSLRTNRANTAVAIYNLMGKEIKTIYLSAANQKVDITLAELDKGLYILKAKSDGQSQSVKILIGE